MQPLTFQVLPDGKLPIGIRETLQRVIPTYAGRRVKLHLQEAREKRSLDQNNYLYGVIEPHVRNVRAESGDPVSLDQVHEELLSEFAPTVVYTRIDGSKATRPMRSHEMSVAQMTDYITGITARMAQFGFPVPVEDDNG